jgi:hypothetical protein
VSDRSEAAPVLTLSGSDAAGGVGAIDVLGGVRSATEPPPLLAMKAPAAISIGTNTVPAIPIRERR